VGQFHNGGRRSDMAEGQPERSEPNAGTSLSAAPLPGHGDEPPKGVFAMAVSILWGVLAFGFGFEAVVNFNDWLRPAGSTQDAIIAGVDLILCFALGVLAVILWKARDWLPRRVADSAIAVSTNPSVWVAVALVILILSALPQLRLQPQKAAPTADEIATAVARALPKEIILSPTVSQSHAANPSISAIEATKNLSSADHERLANALYDVSQLLERAVKLSDDATGEIFQIGNDAVDTIGGPTLFKEKIAAHRQKLISLSDAASSYWKDFEAAIDSQTLKYYAAQITYIMGDKPKGRIISLRGEVDGYIQYFDAWSNIKNIEDAARAQRQIILFQQSPFSQSMGEIRMWAQESNRRLQEIRNAAQRG
jgi:hypothetical protein